MAFIHVKFKLKGEQSFRAFTMPHNMCPRKQTTEPKLVVSFFSGEVTFNIHQLLHPHNVRSIYAVPFFYGLPCIETVTITIYEYYNFFNKIIATKEVRQHEDFIIDTIHSKRTEYLHMIGARNVMCLLNVR